MKYFFTLACLLAALMGKAQIVNIPDSNFKFYLVNHLLSPDIIDINGNGEIEESEALTITRLHIQNFGDGFGYRDGGNIKDLTGISAFKNLKYLYLSCNNQTVDLSGCTELDTLGAQTPFMTSLNISSCNKLSYFFLEPNNLGQRLTSLTIGIQDSLKSISIQQQLQVDTLDLRGCKNLLRFSCPEGIKKLYMTGLTKLIEFEYLQLNSNALEYADFGGCSSLRTIDDGPGGDGFINLSYLNLKGCSSLSTIVFDNTGLPFLDLSPCYNLRYLRLHPSAIMDLNIKNGSSCDFFDVRLQPGSNICADEFEVGDVKSALERLYENVQFNVNSYCTFFPGGQNNTITGKTRIDINNNGCDTTDKTIGNVPIKITDTSGNFLIRYTTPGGDYAHYPTIGIFTLTPYFPFPYFTINPSSADVIFDTVNNLTSTRNFCVQPNGVHNDLEVIFLPSWPNARPGSDAGYSLVYKNRGTTTLSGNVQVHFDNSKMNFVSASAPVASQSTGALVWNYNNLLPFENRTIYVTFNLLPPPINNINDTISYLAAITPSAADETAFDNSFILPQRVRGAFDPNEKQCLEGSKIDISKIGDYLHYQIHFQNEGTDTAFNIVVADTLSDKLDWNSFELISSSHPVEVNQKNGRLEFIFENIKLPYKAINEPASNGYVAFKIKPKPSVVVGDSLNNTAAIYFDFNMPVITNRATTVITNASTPVPVKVEYFSISSRNNINALNWKAACSNGSAKFSIERSDDGIHFTSIGSITATAVRCQLPFNFSDNDPVAGKNYYRLKITDADGISFYSKTLVTGNNKTGLQITGIANNIVYFSSNKQQAIQMKVVAADGKILYQQSKTIAARNSNVNLQIKNAARQICTLIVYTNEGEIVTRRFIR